jgi:hypothetical protein
MFAVGPVLVSDALLDAAFACDLGACRGACCVVGERGAPLEKDEIPLIEQARDVVERDLRPEARAALSRGGAWEGNDRSGFATATVAGRECVFVVYERGPGTRPGQGVATCAIQRAFQAGRLGWEKPISCHLYPIRVERIGEGDDAVEVLNYEQIDLCAPARSAGRRARTPLARFLERPLTRRYGAPWYAQFLAAWRQRRADLQVDDQLDDHHEPAFTLPVLTSA